MGFCIFWISAWRLLFYPTPLILAHARACRGVLRAAGSPLARGGALEGGLSAMDESLIILRCAAPARVLRRGGCAASRLRAPGARARARARRDAQAGGRRRGELSSGNFLGWRATWSPPPPGRRAPAGGRAVTVTRADGCPPALLAAPLRARTLWRCLPAAPWASL